MHMAMNPVTTSSISTIFAGAAYKTEEKVHQVINEMYHDAPDGLAGNEDCGQMSAWYILSAMVFIL